MMYHLATIHFATNRRRDRDDIMITILADRTDHTELYIWQKVCKLQQTL